MTNEEWLKRLLARDREANAAMRRRWMARMSVMSMICGAIALATVAPVGCQPAKVESVPSIPKREVQPVIVPAPEPFRAGQLVRLMRFGDLPSAMISDNDESMVLFVRLVDSKPTAEGIITIDKMQRNGAILSLPPGTTVEVDRVPKAEPDSPALLRIHVLTGKYARKLCWTAAKWVVVNPDR